MSASFVASVAVAPPPHAQLTANARSPLAAVVRPARRLRTASAGADPRRFEAVPRRFIASASATIDVSALAGTMKVSTKVVKVETGKDDSISFVDLTPQLRDLLAESGVANGTATVFSRHTTTAIYINENEERLLEDIKAWLRTVAPAEGSSEAPGSLHYLHNDLHLRPGIPEDEPINAHSHLQAMLLGQSESIPVYDGQLALGQWQSVMLIDLDGPRTRTVVLQVSGI